MRGADDPFEVGAEMAPGEIGRFSALADHDHARLGLKLGDRLDQIAMAQPRGHIGNACAFEDGACVFQNRASASADEFGALRVKLGQFLQ